MNKKLIIIVCLLVVGGVFLFFLPIKDRADKTEYESAKYGLSFEYSDDYFIAFEQNMRGERENHAIVLAQDTPEIRELISNPESATEAPPTITISIYQNNLDNYTLESFVEGTSFSNFKLSDGNVEEIVVDGEKAWRYQATGLYENDNVVVVRPEYVYMFTGFFNSPEDNILKEFDRLLDSVTFSEPVSEGDTATSADNAPPGSIHNLPVPEAVSAVKAYVASKTGVSEGVVIVMTAYEMDWSDSCLGLGGPAESCLAAITPGYEVTVMVNGEEQTYRTNADGSEIRQSQI